MTLCRPPPPCPLPHWSFFFFMPRLGSTFATPGRAAFGNAGVVPEADLTHAGCQSAYGIQQEQGFPSYFPSFVFVDSHTGQAHGDIDVSSVFLATQVVHEVDEPYASGIRGYYCLDYADLRASRQNGTR